jgi:hypothetical protein
MQIKWIPVVYEDDLICGTPKDYMGSIISDDMVAFEEDTKLKVGGYLRFEGKDPIQITDLSEVTDLRRLRKSVTSERSVI